MSPTVVMLQPFSQKPRTPTFAKEFQIGLYDPAEADLKLFCNIWSAGILGERLYLRSQLPTPLIVERLLHSSPAILLRRRLRWCSCHSQPKWLMRVFAEPRADRGLVEVLPPLACFPPRLQSKPCNVSPKSYLRNVEQRGENVSHY